MSVPGVTLLLHPVILPELGVQVHVNNVPVTFEVSVEVGRLVIALLLVFRTVRQIGDRVYGHDIIDRRPGATIG